MEKIYTVTAFQRIRHSKVGNLYLPDFGDRRCVGWFKTKDEAENAIVNNFNDIYENMYTYAVIEEMEPGIKLPETKRYLYEWKNSGYESIQLPLELGRYSNFGIG